MVPHNSKNFHLFLCIFLIVLQGCTHMAQVVSNKVSEQKIQQQALYAIKDVNIIPMTTGSEIIEQATVVVQDHKITAINGPIPEAAQIIDGKGKWLIPGLIDMHVHNPTDLNFGASYPTKSPNFLMDTQDLMLLYIANGVTTAFELSGRPEHMAQRNEIVKTGLIAPRIALAALIDGGNGSGLVANTPSDGRQTVRIAKALGYEFIKIYSSINLKTFSAIVDEANKQGMKVVGHIPDTFKGRLSEAFVPHFDMVAHAEEYAKQSPDFSDRDAAHFAKLAKDNNTWLTATLITMVRIAEQARTLDSLRDLQYLSYVHPLLQSKWLTANQYNRGSSPDRIAHFEKMAEFHIRLVKAFKRAGVPIVAGTDAGTSGVVWGYALHDELELLVKAGLTPAEALAAATRLPAKWLQLEDKVGTIQPGKWADMVLLDANPLENIRNTKKISGVFINGQWVDKSQLAAMLSKLAKKNIAGKDKYDWKKRNEL